ncbi:MAG TPA: CheR family methyltransferase [Roseiflexaceae bacterium]|nr:CheR family methyltransferase [Roseiflexaceae bacterium]
MEQDTSEATFPVIGVGVGIDGLAALQTFVAHLSPESGTAFVLMVSPASAPVQALTTLLQPCTSVPVVAAQGPLALVPNQIVVVSSGRQPSLRGEVLDLLPADPPDTQQAPIDRLFRALAERYAERAGAVVLAGGGSDGVLGIQQIKEGGGLTLAQEPREAQPDAMPRAAVATGMVDLVRPAAELPEALLAYWRNARRIGLLAETAPDTTDQAALGDILAVLRARTRHDFAPYKRAVVLRRLGRRMHLSGVDSLAAYLHVLRARPEETQALLRDLLIGVTCFFRDPPVWQALWGIMPQLFANKPAGAPLRVWVAGCASGAEAYSLAMLLLDYARNLDAPPAIQVFATDIDEEAIAKARQGRYPPTIAADVPQAYLERFFRREYTGYHVSEELREVVLFAVHNLLRDPPFSRLDLVSCRNLLIYFDTQAQEQVLSLFHFTIQPGGYLLLGTAEAADTAQRFVPIDIAHRLYQRRGMAAPLPQSAPALPLAGLPAPATPARAAPGEARSLDELSNDLLVQHGPPSVIVNEHFDILHLSQGAGRFLQFRPGEPSFNLLQLIHPGLRLHLRAALFEAVQRGVRSEAGGQVVELEGSARQVTTVVQPIGAPAWARGALLVLFYDLPLVNPAAPQPASQIEALASHVEDELQRTKRLLQVQVEQYETVLEEYKAANEELQTLNEELQTSKEQLQALNEELLTVNGELRHKVAELGQTNNDLQNLMAATAIPTLFVDRRLLITRYTPGVLEMFNLIAADLHRPLAHITHSLEYPALLADARLVLGSAAPLEREVRSDNNRHYLVRLYPYRTSESEADGVVLTFVEITARKHAEQAVAADLRDTRSLRDLAIRLASEDDLHALYDQILEAAIALLQADSGSIQRYDEQSHELVMLWTRHLPAHLAEHVARVSAGSATAYGVLLASGEHSLVDFDMADLPDPDGALRMHHEAGFVSALSMPLIARSGRRIGMVTTLWRVRHRPAERELRFLDLLARQVADLLDQRLAEQALRKSEARFRLMADTVPEFIWLTDAEGRVEFFNRRWIDYAGARDEPETMAEVAARFVHSEDAPRLTAAFQEARRTGNGFEIEQRNRSAGGEYRWFLHRAEPYCDPASGRVIQWVGVGIDIHDRKRAVANLGLLVDFSERLATLSSVATIMEIFGQQIGAALGASSCILLEIDQAQGEAVVVEYWLRSGARPSADHYRLSDELGGELLRLLAGGQTVVVRDVAGDARVGAGAVFAIRRVGSFVAVPLLREGVWRFLLGVFHERPYDWSEDEIDLLTEAASRIWHKLEHSRAEAALRESEARFRLLVEGARDYAMFLLDPDNRITFWSSGAERVFGWSEAEARGQSGGLIFTAKDRARGEVEREVQTALREGRALDRRWHIRKDGTLLFIDGAMIRLDDERGGLRGFVKIGRDATAQREAEEALQRARDELERRVAERTADLAASNQALQQEIAERRQVEAERAALLQRIITAQEDERGRIARELHDSLGQFLTALSVRLAALQSQATNPPALGAALDDLRRVAVQLDQELDRLTVELRPPALDDTGLADALASYTAEWSVASGVPVDLIAVKLDGVRLPAAVETTVYRIVQEALTNVLKHAQASLVSVILERRSDALRVIIEDNGRGFSVEAAPPDRAAGRRLGLLGMHERASLAGGTITIESTPGEGTSIFVSIPLDP